MSRKPAGDSVDVHIGKRVRERRVQLGLSQKDLAEVIDVSFQQLQKNERGTNRIGASRLHELGVALDVPVSFFFDELPPQPPLQSLVSKAKIGSDIADLDVMARKEVRDLVESYYAIRSRTARRRFMGLIKGLARATAAPDQPARRSSRLL